MFQIPPILLLTGPAGAGKTATVRVLARELGCQLQEWANPLGDSYNPEWTSGDDWKSSEFSSACALF